MSLGLKKETILYNKFVDRWETNEVAQKISSQFALQKNQVLAQTHHRVINPRAYRWSSRIRWNQTTWVCDRVQIILQSKK